MKNPAKFICCRLLPFFLQTILFSSCGSYNAMHGNLGNLNSIQITNYGKIYAIDNNNTVIMYDQHTMDRKLLIESHRGLTFNSLFFPDSLNGFIAEKRGRITQTDDGGKTWSTINLNNKSNFNKVYFLNDRIGYLIGGNGSIYKTDCGGCKWIKQDIHCKNNIYGITFIDSLIGYIVGSNGLILNTTDGGKVWQSIQSDYEQTFRDIKFLSPRVGYIAGDYGTILKTKDSGSTWIKINTEREAPVRLINTTSYYEINFINGEVYIKGKENTILRLNEDNSREFFKSVPENYLTRLNMIGNPYEMAYGINDLRLKYVRDTLKWSKMDLPSKRFMNDICFINVDTGFIVGGHGTILKTSDGGNHWDFINSGTKRYLTSVQFVNDHIGYITSFKGTILKTIDGGITWNVHHFNKDVSSYLNRTYFINADTGFSVGYPRKILKTINGGDNWENTLHKNKKIQSKIELSDAIYGKYRLEDPGLVLYGLCFATADTGYAVGSIGIKYKTTDGGNNWVQIAPESEFNGYLSSVYFTNSKIGFAIGHKHGHAVLQCTYDGGKTWQTQNYNSFSNFNCIKFVDDNIGYIVGNCSWQNMILKTTDGGKHWKARYLNNQAEINSIFILNKNTGYAVNLFHGKAWKFNPMEEF